MQNTMKKGPSTATKRTRYTYLRSQNKHGFKREFPQKSRCVGEPSGNMRVNLVKSVIIYFRMSSSIMKRQKNIEYLSKRAINRMLILRRQQIILSWPHTCSSTTCADSDSPYWSICCRRPTRIARSLEAKSLTIVGNTYT